MEWVGHALPFAALTSEGEQIQLPTEGHLAVRADCFHVASLHLAVAFVLLARLWCSRGGHVGGVGTVYMYSRRTVLSQAFYCVCNHCLVAQVVLQQRSARYCIYQNIRSGDNPLT